MEFSIKETHFTDCNGHFEVTISLSHNGSETVDVRVSLKPGFDKNVQNVSLDKQNITIDPNQTVEVLASGELQERCKHGEFAFEWVQTVGGSVHENTRDSILIIVASVPIEADDNPDPVTADPAGVFQYNVKVACCEGTAGALNVDYITYAASNVSFIKADPASPITLNCPGDTVIIGIDGILTDPTRQGKAVVKFVGGGRCFVRTTINPSRDPDEKAHADALKGW